jgi:anti-sigma factor (TIGR02949 family)
MPNDHPAPFDCHDAVRRLWDYLDGALGDEDVRAIDAHLARCAKCPPHFRFERAFLDAVRAARAEHSGVPALRTRVVAALTREGFAVR